MPKFILVSLYKYRYILYAFVFFSFIIFIYYSYTYFFNNSCNNCCSYKSSFNQGTPQPPQGGGGSGLEAAVVNQNGSNTDESQMQRGYEPIPPMEPQFNGPAEVTSSPIRRFNLDSTVSFGNLNHRSNVSALSNVGQNQRHSLFPSFISEFFNPRLTNLNRSDNYLEYR